jgi:hypothetical protein
MLGDGCGDGDGDGDGCGCGSVLLHYEFSLVRCSSLN